MTSQKHALDGYSDFDAFSVDRLLVSLWNLNLPACLEALASDSGLIP
uniref:Uncharacterized protein n=1 Tax=Utricularia reniformis TaxID=192314 RepID=A0A1Y0B4Q7_9LAMI|nr:hypothetical protein AEK19_MT2238 [Utricularia reniformis]ART32383.1 hypothetical protein AEK19_MT2238 [Utricularia reniformis]